MERPQVVLNGPARAANLCGWATRPEKAKPEQPNPAARRMHPLYSGTVPDCPNEMTDTEFDVLDELYFVQSYGALHGQLQISEEALRETLVQLARKGWVKVLRSHDDEAEPEEAYRAESYANYYFLATKAGLLAHNSR
jgi:hypothetical protein